MNSTKGTALVPWTDKAEEKMCCIFSGSLLALKPTIDDIFREETAKMLQSEFMRQVF